MRWFHKAACLGARVVAPAWRWSDNAMADQQQLAMQYQNKSMSPGLGPEDLLYLGAWDRRYLALAA